MAMDDTQRGAAIAMAFAHSQGRDPEGGLPQENQGGMTIEGPNVNDLPAPGNFAPPLMGPGLPSMNPNYHNALTRT
jgi:hypothetical protein